MIQKLEKQLLDFNITYKFFIENLKDTNSLCSYLLKYNDLKDGKFFTFLPKNANSDQLHKFDYGGILPQYPEETCIINGETAKYSLIPTTRKEISAVISNKLKDNPLLICIFDDVKRSPSDKNLQFSECEYYFEGELYYVVNHKTNSKELIKNCLRKSNSFWHSLCIISESTLNDFKQKKLSLDELKAIAKNIKIAICGAYDGEGYVFWEKNQ